MTYNQSYQNNKKIPADCFRAFQQGALYQSNFYRAKHQATPQAITSDEAMQKTTKEWAEFLTEKWIIGHNPKTEIGENIFYAWNTRGFSLNPRSCQSN